MINWRKKALLGLGLMALTTGGVLGVTGVAIASADQLPAIEDVTGYPAPLPEGCPDGANALVGVLFDDGHEAPNSDLNQLHLNGGDTLTMSWTAVAEGCAAPDGEPLVPITLAVYGVDAPVFDQNVDQPLLATNSCGPGAGPCALGEGSNALSLTLPVDIQPCFSQVDAVLGAPLKTVGPNGSYYTANLRGTDYPTLLIAGGFAALDPCGVTTTTEATTTTVAPTTTTTAEVLPSTVPVTSSTEAPAVVSPAVAVEATSAARGGQLPVTGGHPGVLVLLGASLMVVGAAAVTAGRSRKLTEGSH